MGRAQTNTHTHGHVDSMTNSAQRAELPLKAPLIKQGQPGPKQGKPGQKLGQPGPKQGQPGPKQEQPRIKGTVRDKTGISMDKRGTARDKIRTHKDKNKPTALPDEAPPMGKIHPFSKTAVTFEPVSDLDALRDLESPKIF